MVDSGSWFYPVGTLLCSLGWHKWTKSKLGGVTHIGDRFYIRCCQRLWCYKTQHSYDYDNLGVNRKRMWRDGQVDPNLIAHHSTGAQPFPPESKEYSPGTIEITTTLTFKSSDPIIGLTDDERGPPA